MSLIELIIINRYYAETKKAARMELDPPVV